MVTPIAFPDIAVENEGESALWTRKRRVQPQYLVKWRRHDASERTWPPSTDLSHGQDFLAVFRRCEDYRGEM